MIVANGEKWTNDNTDSIKYSTIHERNMVKKLDGYGKTNICYVFFPFLNLSQRNFADV